MNRTIKHSRLLLLFVCLSCAPVGTAVAQVGPQPPDTTEAERRAQEALAAPSTEESAEKPAKDGIEELSYFELFLKARWLMLPIVLMSLVVAVFAIERAIAIRRSRVLPPDLVGQLHEAIMHEGSLDPRWVYRVCQPFPSAMANVIKNGVLRVGRPHVEVEQAMQESSQREADRLYANVRPLTLAAAITPLMGLLGTVWGMIEAFNQTATGEVTANKAEELAGGIYTALLTTFAGLAVAIPAAVLAHWFEGRIQALFRELDELLLLLLPKLERYEGKLRVQRRPGKDEVHGLVEETSQVVGQTAGAERPAVSTAADTNGEKPSGKEAPAAARVQPVGVD